MPRKTTISRLTATSCAVLATLYAGCARAATNDDCPPTKGPDLAANFPVEASPPIVQQLQTTSETADAPVVIDNDQAQLQQKTEYDWKEVPDAPGKTHISAGARFPIEVQSALSSKTAKVGDPLEARLKVDLKIGGRLVARKGCVVIGHVSSVTRARKMLAAEFALGHRWMRPAGCIGVDFDYIINEQGEHLPLVAGPAQQARIVKNLNEGRVIGVNAKGQLASPLSGQLKSQAIHMAIRVGASAGGVFSFGAVPAAYACLGAINPSFAFMHPVGKNVRHRRLKGFGMGLVAGLPGGFLIADSIIRGPEAIVQPGDIFEAEFHQDFTGEAATDAQLIPGARTQVHGEILPDDGKKKQP